MIAIIDYGMGNIRSVQKALERVGARTTVTNKPPDILNADKVVLPGVGAIGPAVKRLQELGLTGAIKGSLAAGKPFLGICLGLQLLFEKSDEGGDVSGMGVLPGRVIRFKALKVPHMGWNTISPNGSDNPLFEGIPPDTYFYFCHSYYVEPQEDSSVASTTDYGLRFASSIRDGHIFGVQFHPEKSQEAGLGLLKNFVSLTP